MSLRKVLLLLLVEQTKHGLRLNTHTHTKPTAPRQRQLVSVNCRHHAINIYIWVKCETRSTQLRADTRSVTARHTKKHTHIQHTGERSSFSSRVPRRSNATVSLAILAAAADRAGLNELMQHSNRQVLLFFLCVLFVLHLAHTHSRCSGSGRVCVCKWIGTCANVCGGDGECWCVYISNLCVWSGERAPTE